VNSAQTGERSFANDHQRFVSDVFHHLGQPLTELRCSIELALRKPLDCAGYREALGSALQAANRVVDAASFARQLAEAEYPGGNLRVLDVTRVLQEAIDDFLPVADDAKVAMAWRMVDPVFIRADPARLHEMLFRVMDCVLHAASSGTMLTVSVESGDVQASLNFSTHFQPLLWAEPSDRDCPKPPEEMHRSLQVARRMVQAIGGTLLETADSIGNTIRIRLPLAENSETVLIG